MIETTNVQGRDDWFMARAEVAPQVDGQESPHVSQFAKTYIAFETTRHAAFMAVARQLANDGYIKW